MKNFKAFAAVSCLGLASLALAPSASADQWNKRTIITVGEAIQVPGKVLQPGKYVMRLMDSPSNRHVVQIFNEREDQLQTTILAIPNYRLQPTGKTEFQWWETPAGQPKALRAWFYPGDNFGQEFAYPKNEAMQIAAVANTNVPTTYAQTEAELATARVGTVDRAGTELELDRQTYSRNDGMQPTEVAQNRTTQAPAAAAAPAQETAAAATPAPAAETSAHAGHAGGEALPRTASPMPAVGLAGLLALGAGVVVRRFGSR
ncbi:MAG TPA: hypothetical protein VEQ63_01215 [Bryobacteraceae bacterium]|nr:hypothetical protein [Bryobacteraceae bacterium]